MVDQYASGQGEPSVQDHGLFSPRDALALQLGELARDLQKETDPDGILQKIVGAAINLIPGVEEGSISAVKGRRQVLSRAPSSQTAARLDVLQNEANEGPCLDAIYEQQTVRVPDMRNEPRWPNFSTLAADTGAGSMLCFQLYVEGDNLGALNLYSTRVNAFTDESEHVGLLVAAHAAIGYAEAVKTEQLEAALQSRDLIGQAKGILMERHKITADQASSILNHASSRSNVKLHDIAERLVATGEVPTLTKASSSE
ncbi:transcriptional regulator with GAF, ATPase, and Fis domain [Arthrobacter sp. CAN_A214]|uniref:GAF and ANTAR domain-containing protein n=1 Tax=Arthrobacter sp. CAN_A214 TaxID=2787720 RepID=UPI0018CAA57D